MTNSPLNERQLQVLRWIADGCPDGVWADSTYKATAVALQNRQLVNVSKRGGIWRATLTDDGRFYLKHDAYPKHRLDAARQPAPRKSAPPPQTQPTPPPEPNRPEPRPPSEPSPSQQLLDQVHEAGGRLHIQTQPYSDPRRDLVTAAHREGIISEGQLLRWSRCGFSRAVIHLEDDPQAAVPRRTIKVPGRVAKPHPAVELYRNDRDFHGVSTGSLARATRILQAIAVALTSAGMAVTAPDRRKHNRRNSPKHQIGVADNNGFSTHLRIMEKSAPGGDPMPYYYPAYKKQPPIWQMNRQKKFIPTDHLILEIGEYADDGRKHRFQDSKRRSLEEQVADIVHEVEMRAFAQEAQRTEQRLQEQEREERWLRSVERAKVDASAGIKAEALRSQANAWHDSVRLGEYVDALAARAQRAEDPDERRQGEEWVTWAREYIRSLNPLEQDHFAPDEPEFRREHLEPYLRGWSEEFLRRLGHR